jgi:hypothetical protein
MHYPEMTLPAPTKAPCAEINSRSLNEINK